MRGYVDIASRHSGSIDVALMWDGAGKKLTVVAHDKLTGEDLEIPVDREHAAEVYRHPFAYAPTKSLACSARATGRSRKAARR